MNLGPREANTPPSSRRVLLRNIDGQSIDSTGEDDLTDLKFDNIQNEAPKSARSFRGILSSVSKNMSSFLNSADDSDGEQPENPNFRTQSSIESMYSENNDLMRSARSSIQSIVEDPSQKRQ